MKVPRQCRLALLLNVDSKEIKAFGSEEGRETHSGAGSDVE
jgi:hypothetical protein